MSVQSYFRLCDTQGIQSVISMVNSAGTPSSVEEWETLVHCRREQGKLYFWGSQAWEKAPELCRQSGLQLCSVTPQLLRESVPGYARPHLKHTVI